MAGIEELKSIVSKRGGVARANLYRVDLPPIPNSPLSTSELNILCSAAQLPGRMLGSHDKIIGSFNQKIAYSEIHEDINLSFTVMNDYGIRKYFEQWQSLVLNKDTYEIGYILGPNGYGRTVKIHQLKKGIGLPIFSNPFIDIDLYTRDQIVYSVELQEAYPINIGSIELYDASASEAIQMTVQLSYRKWKTL